MRQRRDGDAGEQQRADHELAVPSRDRDEAECGGHAAEEGGDGHSIDAEQTDHRRRDPVPERDDAHGGQRRASGHADHAGIGEGVTKEALHHGARDGERHADEHGEQRARQTNLQKDQPLTLGVDAGPCQNVGDHTRQHVERDAGGADRQRKHGHGRQQDRRRRDDVAAPAAALVKCHSQCRSRNGRTHCPLPLFDCASSG